MRRLRCGELAAKQFSQSSNSAVKTASKMAGAETMSVEMMPAVVVMVVVSSDNELASVVWPVSPIVRDIIRSAVDAWHISSNYVVTSASREKQGNGCCARHQHFFHRLHGLGAEGSISLYFT